jgi:hypothetical protein
LIVVLFIAIISLGMNRHLMLSPSAASQAKWTFMVYLDADNNLEGAGIVNFNQMEWVGSTTEMNIVVQMDRVQGFDESNGDWTGTRRYYVTKDADSEVIHSTLIQDLGELNMGDPGILYSFGQWATQAYPAQHYALVLWDHGSGYPGVCFDDTNGGDCLTMNELKQALSNIKHTIGADLDVVVFDACFMGMIEIAHQITNYVDFMVASEESEPGLGSPYDTILASLASTPGMSGSELASTITTKYMISYTDGLANPEDVPTATDAAYDLSKEPALASAISTFGEALKASFNQTQNAIVTAKSQSETFYGQFIDLYDFTQRVRNSVAVSAVQSAADNLLTKIQDFVVTEGHGADHPNAHGVTIYYPEKYERASYAGSEAGRMLDFPWDTRWDQFLDFGVNVQVDLVPQFPEYTASGNTSITNVATGDVDGDGIVEVISIGNSTDEYGAVYGLIGVYKASENGLMEQANYTLNLGQPEDVTSVCCGDTDRDLKDEIVVTAEFYNTTDYQWYTSIVILSGDAGKVQLQAYDASTSVSLESLDVSDVDADGYNEIVISGHLVDEWGDEYAYIAVGNNTVPTEMALENYYSWNVGWTEELGAVAVGDVDADGLAEIIVAGIYYGDEYEGPAYGYVAVLNYTDNMFWIQAVDSVPSTWIDSLEVADVNGDSISELVVSGYSWDDYGYYYFYLGIATNRPSGQVVWLYEQNYSIGEDEDLYSVDTGDVDGDGISEILVSGSYYDTSDSEWNAYGAVFSWSNSTGLTLEDSFSTANGQGYAVTTADINNDTQPEVISCNTQQGNVYAGQISVQQAAEYVPDAGTITGVVTSNMNPVAGATIKIVIPRYDVAATTTTLANGSYTVTNLKPRTYDVEVYIDGNLSSVKKGVMIKAGETAGAQIELSTTAAGGGFDMTPVIVGVVVALVVVVAAFLVFRMRRRPSIPPPPPPL